MSTKTKQTIVIIGGIVLILLIVFTALFWKIDRLENQLATNSISIDHKALTESLQRAETLMVESNKQLDLFAQQNGLDIEMIRDDLEKINADLIAVASTKAQTTTIIKNNYISDNSKIVNPEQPVCKENNIPLDNYGYTTKLEEISLQDSNGMNIARIGFQAAKSEPWSSTIYGIEYVINNTVSTGPNKEVIIHTELLARNKEIQPEKTFRIEGVESRVLQVPEPPPSFDFWDPAIFLLGQLGLDVYPGVSFSASINIGASIMSYNNWRFLALSIGVDGWNREFIASFIPFLYNVGEPLPFFSDLFIFPYVSISHEGDVGVGAGIGTRL